MDSLDLDLSLEDGNNSDESWPSPSELSTPPGSERVTFLSNPTDENVIEWQMPQVQENVLLLDSQHGGLESGHIEPTSLPASQTELDDLPRRRGFMDQNIPENINSVNWFAAHARAFHNYRYHLAKLI